MIVLALVAHAFAQTPATPPAVPYAPVAGLWFPDVSELKTYGYFHDLDFTFQLHRPLQSGYPDGFIHRAMYASSLASFRAAEALGALEHACRRGTRLDIYEVSLDVLNDASRFPADFVGNPAAGRGDLLGFFDPRNDVQGMNAIVVTPVYEAENYRIIVHEIAHYWYLTFCLDRYTKQTSEEFAVQIQTEQKL